MSTGARVGGVRPPGIPRESWLRRKTIKSEAARRVREVTDNRTNEPTEAQGVAATVALARSIHGNGADHEDFDYYRKHVENALIASGLVASAKALERVEKFLDGVHGLNEMNVVRGLRKVIAGEESTFSHEVRLSVYGEPCGHTPQSHYPAGYGKCQPCRYPDLYEEEDCDDESSW